MSNVRGGRLYVIPTTLGLVPPANVLPQATLAVARRLSHFVAETPKLARQFLKSLELAVPLQSIAIAELSEHTRPGQIAELLSPARAGHDLGLVSDAGCPGVADPGAWLVAAAHRAGIPVTPLPGPSAILLALMASGLNGQAFAFHGYLPAKVDARAGAIRRLDEAIARTGATQIFIETPYRNEAMLDALLATCQRTTQLCVAVDLTLPSEQIVRQAIAAWNRPPRLMLARRPAVFLLGRDETGAATLPRRS
jgi:16S rRNA (cytidine1402-2'-O)-methyltransferase